METVGLAGLITIGGTTCTVVVATFPDSVSTTRTSESPNARPVTTPELSTEATEAVRAVHMRLDGATRTSALALSRGAAARAVGRFGIIVSGFGVRSMW